MLLGFFSQKLIQTIQRYGIDRNLEENPAASALCLYKYKEKGLIYIIFLPFKFETC